MNLQYFPHLFSLKSHTLFEKANFLTKWWSLVRITAFAMESQIGNFAAKRKGNTEKNKNKTWGVEYILCWWNHHHFNCVFHLKRNRNFLNIDSLWAFLRFLYNNLHHNWFGNWESFHCSYILYSIFAFVRVNVFVFYIVLVFVFVLIFVYVFVVVIVLVFFICICTCNWKSNWFSLVGRQIWPWLESGPHNLFLLAAIILLWILNWTAKAASFGQLARHTKFSCFKITNCLEYFAQI